MTDSASWSGILCFREGCSRACWTDVLAHSAQHSLASRSLRSQRPGSCWTLNFAASQTNQNNYDILPPVPLHAYPLVSCVVLDKGFPAQSIRLLDD
ncbi:hypothetical protein VTK26DRAFT_2488 [Humicola hyalothermophila]